MNYVYLLLVLVVKTRALIQNGTGEKCEHNICGYGAYCKPATVCDCETGFGSQSKGEVMYCIKDCDTDHPCPVGATCKTSLALAKFGCYCNTDYKLSFLGECVSKATTTAQPTTTGTSTKDTLTINELPKSTDAPTTECRTQIRFVVSVVFNGVQLAIVTILVIILLRQRVSAKNSPNLNARHVFEVTTRGNTPNQDLSDIDVTSPAYHNSFSTANGIQSSDGNDTEMPHTSNYVHTAVYDDIDPPVNSDYINTPQPSQDYVGLRLGLPTEQTVYEQLQNH